MRPSPVSNSCLTRSPRRFSKGQGLSLAQSDWLDFNTRPSPNVLIWPSLCFLSCFCLSLGTEDPSCTPACPEAEEGLKEKEKVPGLNSSCQSWCGRCRQGTGTRSPGVGGRAVQSIGCLSTDHSPCPPETAPRLRGGTLNRGTAPERLRWRWRRRAPPLGREKGTPDAPYYQEALSAVPGCPPTSVPPSPGEVAFDPLGRSCLSGARLPRLCPCPSTVPRVHPAPEHTGSRAGPPRGSGTWDQPTRGFHF